MVSDCLLQPRAWTSWSTAMVVWRKLQFNRFSKLLQNMEMDNSFMLKQFVAIDELKPSYLSSSLDEFCKVYARAVLKLLSLLPTKEYCSYGSWRREYFFDLKNRKGLVSLERSHLVGICSYKSEGNVDFKSCNCIHYQGNTYTFSCYCRNDLLILNNGERYTATEAMPLADIVWWEQLYNCLCRELEDVKKR